MCAPVFTQLAAIAFDVVDGQAPVFEVQGLIQVEGAVVRVVDTVTVTDGYSFTFGTGWSIDGAPAGKLFGNANSGGQLVEPMLKDWVLADGYVGKQWHMGTGGSGSLELLVWYRPLTPGARIVEA